MHQDRLLTEYHRRRAEGMTAQYALADARAVVAEQDRPPLIEGIAYNGHCYDVVVEFDTHADPYDAGMGRLVTPRDYEGGGVPITGTYAHACGADYPYDASIPQARTDWGKPRLYYIDPDAWDVHEHAGHLHDREGYARGPALDEARRVWTAAGERLAEAASGMGGPTAVVVTVTDPDTGLAESLYAVWTDAWEGDGWRDPYLRDVAEELAAEVEYRRIGAEYALGTFSAVLAAEVPT